MSAEVDKAGKVILISIPIRWRFKGGVPFHVPAGKSIELLDELQRMGDYLNNCYTELKRLAPDT